MWSQIYPAGAVAGLAFAGLAVSNFLHDQGAPHWLTRRIAPVAGGFAYLLAAVWLETWPAILVLSILTLGMVGLRLGFRRGLRGVKGRLPTQDWAEVTYPVAGTLSMIIGWGLLNDRWLGFLPVAFMAWGDSGVGLARETVWRYQPTSIWPLLAMLTVCLGVAALYEPYWVGATGALIGTAAERYRPKRLRFWDDNLNVIAASLAAMGICARVASA